LPLSEKSRVEVCLPDLPLPAYQRLLEALRREFTYALAGSTLVRGLSGTYLSRLGLTVEDRVNLLYSDAALDFEVDSTLVGRYAEALRRAATHALNEETVLVAVHRICHFE
jgi:hypothetical protein